MELASCVCLFLSLIASCAAQLAREPENLFQRYIGLSQEQIAEIERGHAAVKLLPSKTAADITVFGAIYIDASPENYLVAARKIDRLRSVPGYIAIHEFSKPPQLSDLEGFTLEEDDVRNLKNCRPGNCALQLPLEPIETLRKTIDWSAPDVADQLNRLAQQLALKFVTEYPRDGNRALGLYYDKDEPLRVFDQFESLLNQSEGMARYLPEVDRFLRDYPRVTLPEGDEFLYWEKVKFGLKPTLRINQAVIYRPKGADRQGAVVVKQLYASHYFQSALDISVCVQDSGRAGHEGFYLITMKSSRQAGLTGVKGSLIRKAAVGRTLSSLKHSLEHTKNALEGNALAVIGG